MFRRTLKVQNIVFKVLAREWNVWSYIEFEDQCVIVSCFRGTRCVWPNECAPIYPCSPPHATSLLTCMDRLLYAWSSPSSAQDSANLGSRAQQVRIYFVEYNVLRVKSLLSRGHMCMEFKHQQKLYIYFIPTNLKVEVNVFLYEKHENVCQRN